MKSKKNLAATLAFLMTLQATGQPWAVMANEGEEGNEPIIGEAGDDQTAGEMSDDAVIQEADEPADAETPVTEVPEVQDAPATAPAETPAEEEETVPAFAEMEEAGTYTASVKLTGTDETVSPVLVDMGVIKEKAPVMEAQNYFFRKAEVNGQTITAVRKSNSKNGERVFCLLETGDLQELTTGMDVVFTYEYVKPVEEEPAEKEEEKQENKAEETAKPEESVKPEQTTEETPAPEQKDTEEAEPAAVYHEVKFYDQEVKDGELTKKETPIVTQWIKEGEHAVAPAINCPEGYMFTGWSQDANAPITKATVFVARYEKLAEAITLQINYTYEGTSVMVDQPWIAEVQPNTYDGTVVFPKVAGCETYVDGKETDSYTFNKPTESTVINVEYKGVETEYTVKHVFLKADGTVNETKDVVTETLTGGINTPTAAQPKEFAGYTVKAVNNVTIKGEGTVAEVRYAPNAYTVTFQTGEGGSYVAPTSVYVDEAIEQPEKPTKLGYRFVGWEYTQGVDADHPVMPAADVVATAKWVANDEARYTVNYWQEGINGGYELAQDKNGKPDVVTGTGKVGDSIPYQAEDNRYKGFHLNSDKSKEPGTISADGQAVKNVYYDRKTYEIKFMVKSGRNWKEDTSRRITAKYGTDISAKWDSSAKGYVWSTEPGGRTYYSAFTNMPLDGFTCYAQNSGGNMVVNYYVETFTPGEYELKQSVGGFNYGNLTEEDKQPIDGFKYDSWKQPEFDSNWFEQTPKELHGIGINDKDVVYEGGGGYLKYTRNSYALQFNNCEPIPSKSVKFEAPIGQYLPKTATPPATEDSDVKFAGWYTAPVGGEKVDVNTDMIMPSHVVQLYAHWEKAKYTVSYVTNRDGLSYDSKTLEKGSIIETPPVNYDDFQGWYTDPDFAHAFVPGTQIGNHLTLYAKWESDNQTTYSIKYVDENGNELKTVQVTEPVTVGTTTQVTADSLIEVNGTSYYPTETVKTLVAGQKAAENVVVFTCKPVQTWSYTVRYVDKDGKEILERKVVEDIRNTLVQERAVAIEGYQLTSDPIQTLSVDDKNKEIVFKYASTSASYKVEYIGIEENGVETVLQAPEVINNVPVGSFVTATLKTFEDYTPITSGNDLKAAVKADDSTVIRVEYRRCEHTVTYQLDPAFRDLYTGNLPASKQLRTGAVDTVADDLILEGYIFTGWTTSDVTVNSNDKFTMPSKNVTFVGSFTRDLRTVSVDNIAKKYDGTACSLNVSGTVPSDIVTFWSEDGTKQLENSFTNVTDSQKVRVKVRSADNQVREDLIATVTISPRNVTITSKSAEKPYDGNPLTKHEVDVAGDGFVQNEGANYTYTGSQTIPGTSDNTFDYTLKTGTDKSNYVIKTEYGKLNVTDIDETKKYTVTVVAKSDTVKYNGQTQTVSGLKSGTSFTWNNHQYKVEGLTATGSGKDAGSYDNVVTGTAIVKDAQGNDVTSQFNVTTEKGVLTISKRDVTLTSATAGKPYDGSALTAKTVDVTGDGFVEGEGASYSNFASITLPDTVDNTFDYELNNGTKSENYDIKPVYGQLSITDRADSDKFEVTVKAASDNVTYNGKVQTVSGVDISKFGWNGHTYTISGLTAEAAGTNAGRYTNTVVGTPVIKDEAGNDVTAQFKVTTVDGELVINKRKVTLTSGSDSKDYDGSELTAKTVDVTGDGFVEGEGASYSNFASITLPGFIDNTFDYVLKDGTSADNYEIATQLGRLTIHNRSTEDKEKEPVKVSAISDTVTYNGKEQSVSGLEGTSFEWKDHQYTVEGLSAEAKGTDANEEGYTSEVVGTAKVLDADGNDVTAQFKVETEDGSLTINKKAVRITSADDKKTYDGSPLTNDEVTAEGFVEGEGATYNVTGSILLPGTTPNTFTYRLTENTKDINYNISKVEGTLIITDRTEQEKESDKVTVKALSGNAKYDGNDHTVSGLEGTTFEWKGHKYSVTGLSASVTGRDAGTYVNSVIGTAVVQDEYGNNVTKQFKVVTENGTLTIAKRVLTLTSASDKKVYDGYALGNENVFLEGDDFVEGEKPAYVFGTDTKPVDAGTYTNKFSCSFAQGVNADNYDITLKFGELVIEQSVPTIVVEADGADITAEGLSKKYDGKTVAVKASASNQEGKPIDGNFTYTVKDLATGETTTSKEVPAFTNSGKWEVTAKTDNPNCKETSKTVTVEITKRNVLLVSEDQEWIYDGAEHRHEKVNVHESGDGFVAGEEPEFHTFASITDAGSKANEFQYRFNKRGGATTLSRVARFLGIASEDPDNIEANYNIEVQHGTLTVKKAAAENHKLALADRTVTYNGKDQTLEAASSDIKDAKVQYSVDGQTWTDELPAFKHVGKYTIYARAVHGNYEDAETSAVLEIVPAKLTVITDSAEKVYDGKPLTAGGRLEGLAEGDQVELAVTGSQTEVGESINTCELKWTGAEAADYEVTETLGTLKVTPKPAEPEAPKKDETPKAPAKSETKKAAKTPTALGLDPALWTSIMGAAGLGMIGAANLSRKDKKKKDEE